MFTILIYDCAQFILQKTSMIYFNEFLLLAIIHFLAVVAPGPDFAVVVQQSISYGRKIGAITAFEPYRVCRRLFYLS